MSIRIDTFQATRRSENKRTRCRTDGRTGFDKLHNKGARVHIGHIKSNRQESRIEEKASTRQVADRRGVEGAAITHCVTV